MGKKNILSWFLAIILVVNTSSYAVATETLGIVSAIEELSYVDIKDDKAVLDNAGLIGFIAQSYNTMPKDEKSKLSKELVTTLKTYADRLDYLLYGKKQELPIEEPPILEEEKSDKMDIETIFYDKDNGIDDPVIRTDRSHFRSSPFAALLPNGKISDLPIGTVVIDYNTKYNGEPIRWIVAHKNIAGYAATNANVVLVSEHAITAKAFDAPETSNPDTNRKVNGNNNYEVSNIRKWLNSDKNTWHSNTHTYDRFPSYRSEKGFLTNFSHELINTMLPFSVKVSTPASETGLITLAGEKVAIPSKTEMGMGIEIVGGDGIPLDYFTTNERRSAKEISYDALGVPTLTPIFGTTRTSSSSTTDKVVVTDTLGATTIADASLNCGIRPMIMVPDWYAVNRQQSADGSYQMLAMQPFITKEITNFSGGQAGNHVKLNLHSPGSTSFELWRGNTKVKSYTGMFDHIYVEEDGRYTIKAKNGYMERSSEVMVAPEARFKYVTHFTTPFETAGQTTVDITPGTYRIYVMGGGYPGGGGGGAGNTGRTSHFGGRGGNGGAGGYGGVTIKTIVVPTNRTATIKSNKVGTTNSEFIYNDGAVELKSFGFNSNKLPAAGTGGGKRGNLSGHYSEGSGGGGGSAFNGGYATYGSIGTPGFSTIALSQGTVTTGDFTKPYGTVGGGGGGGGSGRFSDSGDGESFDRIYPGGSGGGASGTGLPLTNNTGGIYFAGGAGFGANGVGGSGSESHGGNGTSGGTMVSSKYVKTTLGPHTPTPNTDKTYDNLLFSSGGAGGVGGVLAAELLPGGSGTTGTIGTQGGIVIEKQNTFNDNPPTLENTTYKRIGSEHIYTVDVVSANPTSKVQFKLFVEGLPETIDSTWENNAKFSAKNIGGNTWEYRTTSDIFKGFTGEVVGIALAEDVDGNYAEWEYDERWNVSRFGIDASSSYNQADNSATISVISDGAVSITLSEGTTLLNTATSSPAEFIVQKNSTYKIKTSNGTAEMETDLVVTEIDDKAPVISHTNVISSNWVPEKQTTISIADATVDGLVFKIDTEAFNSYTAPTIRFYDREVSELITAKDKWGNESILTVQVLKVDSIIPTRPEIRVKQKA